MSDKLSVSAIKNGTVIDHIPSGQALRIIYLLSLDKNKHKITLGLHLPSKTMGLKDLIKIENWILSETQANEIVVFAPSATINVIENYEVKNKVTTHLPQSMQKVFICPNPTCITQVESATSLFYIKEHVKHIYLTCHYCEKTYNRDQVKVHI